MEDLELYNSKFKVYPDGLIVATYADKPKFRLPTDEKKKKQKVDMSFLNWSYSTFLFSSITYDNGYIYIDSATGEQLYTSHLLPIEKQSLNNLARSFVRPDSVKRSLSRVYDIIMLNQWDYFFTGTLGDTAFDPTNAKTALQPLQTWLKHMVSRYGLKYILIAELQPISRRIHFHGFTNDVLKVVDSGRRLYKSPKDEKAKKYDLTYFYKNGLDPADYPTVYNLPQWKFGFTTAIKTYNGSFGCYKYITKYITKESKKIFGRYYWSSRNLRRSPDIYVSNFDYDSVYMKEYHIPRTRDNYKYYTFFPGEDGFFWELPDGEFARVADYKTAAENSAAIYDMLSDFNEIDTFSDFEIVGG